MLEEKILEDFRKAMKAKDAVTVSTLSFLRAELKNTAIDKRQEKLNDMEVVTVIKKQIKRRQDSIEQFKQGNRQDLADKETRELEILKSYLPQTVPEEKIKEAIEEVLRVTGAKGLKDMGRVIKQLIAQFAERCDNKLLSELVRERLSRI
ncbi:MAG: hypothetical protein A3J51_05450 [Omnitrophica WOR_2 bacterium RIFCSPHIGHO2_02_FULL_45_21]|nr:MAG: hypothetical protein A3J51_05450 [Omnitrophica WOR_2 bacterium RIFCSPHIGHO2_02_FULL_45_21]